MLQCDTRTSPCPRCQRLKIQCVGQGQQRWKFISKSVDDQAKPISHEPQIEAPSLHNQALAVRPSCSPTNATDRLASALVYRANPELDIRYQLPWNFGTFLWDIPARLGTSAALDAASDVLVTAHARYCAGGRGFDQGLLKKQALAMSVLRQHLLDPAKAFSSETLCAITLLMLSQVWSPRQGSCSRLTASIATH